jgi:uncharacterized delta-60 repeat protein
MLRQLLSFRKKTSGTSTRRDSGSRVRAIQLRLEPLETRCLLNAGALDATFGGTGVVTTSLTKGSDIASAVLIQPWDGKIVAAGNTLSGNFTVIALVRYNANGTLDSTFGSGGIETSKIPTNVRNVAALYPATDTTGNAKKIVEVGAGSLARFNANGSVDTSFGNRGLVAVSATNNIFGLVVQSDGKIVIAGDDKLVRYNPTGTLDATFGSGGIATVAGLVSGGLLDALGLQPDGKLVVAGTTSSNAWELGRYTPGGTLDTTFNSAGAVPGTATFSFAAGLGGPSGLAIYPSTGPDTADYGKIEVAGSLQNNPGGIWGYQVALARFNADGSTDNSFGQAGQVVTPFPTGGMSATATALQADSKILVAGKSVRSVGGETGFGVLRYNTDGSLDTSFGTSGLVQTFNGGGSWANGMALQADGRIVAAGRTNGSTSWDFIVARYLPGPEIGTFAASASTVTSGSGLTLTASNLTDGDPASTGYATITQVAFYALDQSGNQILLGYGISSSGAWTLNYTVTLASGSYTLLAQATDSDGIIGDAGLLSLTVQ